MGITGGFGTMIDLERGTSRQLVMDRDGVKRWADNGLPVPCGTCDFENAKLVGRAKWLCPICGRDFSLEYLFWAEAAHPEWADLPNVKLTGCATTEGVTKK